jgi:dTDP-4-amino-4,6-dideoxygalactose transaminase
LIPQAAPYLRIARFRAEVDAAIASVIGSFAYILGPHVAAFENAFADYLGVSHCVGVNSGTDAIALCLRAIGIGRGDEVITSALTAAATAQAILQCGATPRFVDVDTTTRCINPAAVEDGINSRTAAIIPVHLFGHPADMAAIMKLAERHSLAVVEDCAQAHGATIDGCPVGTFGIAAAFSFYPTKNLGGIGDGGAIVTNDSALSARLKCMRHLGFESNLSISTTQGFNSRLDELQAAILTTLLGHLDDNNNERRAVAARYNERLSTANVDLPPSAPGAVFHQFAICCGKRDKLAEGLKADGIQTKIHYDPGLHRHPAFVTSAPRWLPVTDTLTKRLLSLPIQPEVVSEHVDRVAATIRFVLDRC